MSKQTAVEWFAERIQSNKIFNFENILEQAKAMEQQQLKEKYLKGIENYDPTFKRKEQ